eukprot:2204266-Pyramimonas_sp.AAC.1
MQIIGVHIDPEWSERATQSILSSLSRSLLAQFDALGIVLGGFNFHEHRECRHYLEPPVPNKSPSRLATAFDFLFPRYAEVEQPSYTHTPCYHTYSAYLRSARSHLHESRHGYPIRLSA